MTSDGYNSTWWALVYDQWNEEGGRSAHYERELAFYREQLGAHPGKVLEAACGTGSILLPLLRDGIDIHGFDASLPMLDRLRHKATALGISDIDTRISRQELADFQYGDPFDAILIPAGSIMMLPAQEDQIACLRTIRAHLRPSGRLLLNFHIPTFEDLAASAISPPAMVELDQFTHPETGATIEVSFTRLCNMQDQIETHKWHFTCDGRTEVVPMTARWMYKEEFQLLLRLTGFERWSLYGSCDGRPFPDAGETNDRRAIAYWVAEARGQV